MNTLRVLVLLFLSFFLLVLSQYGGSFSFGSPKKEVSPASTGPENNAEPEASPTRDDAGFSLRQFVYPGSTVVHSSEDMRTMTTPDDTESIAQWYVRSLEQSGFTSKTLVKSTVNGDALHTLVGAGTEGGIRVEIRRKRTDVTAEIRVTLQRQ